MKIQYLLIFIFFLLASACQRSVVPAFGKTATKYMPPSSILAEGILYKYYKDIKRQDHDIATDIYYKHLQLNKDTLHIETFDAGFETMMIRTIHYTNNQFKLINEKVYQRFQKPILSNLSDSILIDWNEIHQNAVLERKIVSKFNTRYYKDSQTAHNDTIIRDVPGKQFQYTRRFINERPEKTDTTYSDIQKIYGKNIGLIDYKYKDSLYEVHHYLVEQLDHATFEILRSNTLKRVAFIDPKNSYNPNPNFKICKEQKDIVDYYNGYPAGHLEGKKSTAWKFINEHLDPNILQGQSGYISVRFVINCEGEIGRFTVEQSDLEFNEYQFSKQAIKHLTEITGKMNPWIPAFLMEENFDSYAYIMYKIKDGEILEILP